MSSVDLGPLPRHRICKLQPALAFDGFRLPSFFALLASGAIFLILELSKPFSGPMMISSAPP
jgi:hypothetical protein